MKLSSGGNCSKNYCIVLIEIFQMARRLSTVKKNIKKFFTGRKNFLFYKNLLD
jgi:hypothetical protein